MSKERSAELDSIRGIAALIVVLFHSWQVMLPAQEAFPFADAAHPIARLIALSPLRLLIAGRAAVIVFFMLSGYVLARSLAHAPSMTYWQFAVRRVCRIWLPFAAAISFAAILYVCVDPKPLPGHDWLNLFWNEPLSLPVLTGHLLMIGTPVMVNLDNVIWSLAHEMRLSLVFPALVLAVAYRPRVTITASLAALLILSSRHVLVAIGAVHNGHDSSELIFSLSQTLRYTAFFVLGIVLAKRLPLLPSGAPARCALWVLSFGLLSIPYLADIDEVAFGAGAFLLIALSLQSASAHSILTHRLPNFLGKISYSLYLLHLPIILAFEHVLYGKLNEWSILAMAVATSFLAAALSYRYVELPSIKLGKALASRGGVARATSLVTD